MFEAKIELYFKRWFIINCRLHLKGEMKVLVLTEGFYDIILSFTHYIHVHKSRGSRLVTLLASQIFPDFKSFAR